MQVSMTDFQKHKKKKRFHMTFQMQPNCFLLMKPLGFTVWSSLHVLLLFTAGRLALSMRTESHLKCSVCSDVLIMIVYLGIFTPKYLSLCASAHISFNH